MARQSAEFVCQACGATASKWSGRCGECGAWNSLSQEAAAPPGSVLKSVKKSKAAPALFESLTAESEERPRFSSGIAEFDRVVGGGLTPGSAILVGGDPGIGKSTLLLQIAATAADLGHVALYISGEEATQQLRMRASRLGVTESAARIAAETNLSAILAALDASAPPDILIIDSIQTLWTRGHRRRAGHRQPGARLGPGAHCLRQAARLRRHPRRPRHQGRTDRRAEGGRAHGGYRALFRGRQHPAISACCAR